MNQLQSALSAEIHISLIDDDHYVLIVTDDILDLGELHKDSCRSVGIRKDHAAIFPVIILFHNPEILIQRLTLIRNPEHICPDIVEGIGDIREKDRLSGIEKGQKAHRQNIIGTHSHENLVPIHVIGFCQRIHQGIAGRLRIQTKSLCVHFFQTFFYFR